MARIRCVRLCVTVGALALLLGTAAAAETLVFSNNPAPGDSFTNTGPNPEASQELGSTDWFYNKVRSEGSVGITTEKPRDGNGSVEFNLGPAGPTQPFQDKAAVAYRPGGSISGGTVQPGTPNSDAIGNFSDLRSVSYDWFRDSSSNTLPWVHPALRIYLAVPGSTGFTFGELVFEEVYQSTGYSAPENAWQMSSITSTTNLWERDITCSSPGFCVDQPGGGTGPTLGDWQTDTASPLFSALVMGFSIEVGSGWGESYLGYADKISWQFAGKTAAHYNFEVVPLPAPALLLLAGLAALGAVGRRARPAA